MQIALGIKLHVGIDHEENIRNGLKEEQSIRKLCRDWQLTRGEVVGILA